ncbi:uncharacterized protein NECHADRAFT_88858 [Fusarium vanettenii 77-13-4]|uniref:Uncharacterized protein n=1 Tax=Fusarium vanettenii (strain ATCC MYA-4622 / CBS 123669 / FGSC 9596 / NRRL 45880 / 77-13-4) TaxID=660122 RepID=C7ZN42_FUSV7|nr:uncharacterized protein NECHADRAFT_88858 [Fusarium vanettenii 77-13-4]EEU34556.1 predicted protein [Fusarium vanettenii 77-13-4]
MADTLAQKFDAATAAAIQKASVLEESKPSRLSDDDTKVTKTAVAGIMGCKGDHRVLSEIEFRVLVFYASRLQMTDRVNILATQASLIVQRRKADQQLLTGMDKEFVNGTTSITGTKAAKIASVMRANPGYFPEPEEPDNWFRLPQLSNGPSLPSYQDARKMAPLKTAQEAEAIYTQRLRHHEYPLQQLINNDGMMWRLKMEWGLK